MEYENEHSNDELMHWGIKGMHWGIRRYQNKDGSLTPAGKKRYDAEMEKVKAKTKKLRNEQRVAKKMSKLDDAKKKLDELKREKWARLGFKKKSKDPDGDSKNKNEESDEQKKERILKKPNAKDVYENRHLFSNKEIAELQMRLIQEENIKKLVPAEVTKGDKFIKKIEDMTTKGISLGKAYNLGATVMNAFRPGTAKLLPKLDLDNLNKGNREQRRKEAEDERARAEAKQKAKDEAKAAAKAEKQREKVAKAEEKAAKAKAEDKAKAERKLAKEMEKYKEYNKAWTEASTQTSQSQPYRSSGSGYKENVSGTSKISGLLGMGSYGSGRSTVNSVVSNLPSVISSIPSGTVNRGQSAVAGLLGMGSSSSSSSSRGNVIGEMRQDDSGNWVVDVYDD